MTPALIVALTLSIVVNQPSPWYDSPEWILVIVGILTAVFIAWQSFETQRAANATAESVKGIKEEIRLMERQAKASEEATAAARQSSEILANIERPWVEIRLTRQGQLTYSVEITNHGRTVAHIREIHISTMKASNNDAMPTTMQTHQQSKILAPQVPWSPVAINLAQDLGEDMHQRVRRGERLSRL